MADKKSNSGKIKPGKAAPLGGQPLRPVDLVKETRQGTSKIHPARDLRKLSESSRVVSTPITFGKSSIPGNPGNALNSGSNWTSLLGKANSGSSSSLIGAGLLSFGIDSLFSSLSNLLGGSGKSLPAPIAQFKLPNSQETTLYSTSEGLSTNQSDAPASAVTATGIYGSSNNSISQAAIVQAVKNALLTSSSLNDIIGEL